MQNERGLSAAYVASGSNELRDSILGQRDATDRVVGDFRAFVAAHEGSLAPLARMHAADAKGLLAELDTARRGVTEVQRATGDVMGYYSRLNGALLAAADALVAEASAGELARMATAHLAFLHAKEETALERAEVAGALSPDGPTERQALQLASCIAARESYLRMFATTAPDDVLHLYSERSADPVFADAARLEQAVLARPAHRIDVAACFQAMTAKLEHLRDIERRSAATLLRHAAARGH
jgi:methyl-accepting chemotaxis protein